MARKKKNEEDLGANVPENDDLPEEEMEETIDDDGEELGVDEMFGNSNPGSAHRDLDVWGSEDYES